MEWVLICSISKQLCEFQRWCIKEEDVVNTDLATKCPRKAKQKKVEEACVVEPFIPVQETKKFGIVTLVTKTYVVYELDGNSICLRGKYSYNVGDKIEV